VAKTLESLIEAANKRLKAGRLGVAIYCPPGRGKLYLRGIFPPKPDSDRVEAFQQKLTLGLSANETGLKVAEARAKEIGSLIAQGRFHWKDYLKADPAEHEQLTVRHWVVLMEREYFSSRARAPKTETTWATDYRSVYQHLDDMQVLSVDYLKLVILEKTQPDTRQRVRYCMALAALGKLASLDIATLATLATLKGNYSSTKALPRELPTDTEIVNILDSLSCPDWVRWNFLMLACYGLRPHELYHLDISDLLKGGEKVRVLSDTKTGSRVVWPIVPDGIDIKELRDPHLASAATTSKRARSNQELGRRISEAFKRWGIGVLPYDLRHAWAVRAICRGLDVSAAVRMMGHSLAVHNKTYQRWLTDADLESAYRRSLNTPK
jgi:integrase